MICRPVIIITSVLILTWVHQESKNWFIRWQM